MIVHLCTRCSTVSCNRIAGDDTPDMVIELINVARNLPTEQSAILTSRGISLLSDTSAIDIRIILYGCES
jgi:hypothetical protein